MISKKNNGRYTVSQILNSFGGRKEYESDKRDQMGKIKAWDLTLDKLK